MRDSLNSFDSIRWVRSPFSTASSSVKEQADALMVPQAVVGSGQLGKFVYVIGQDNKADRRLVTLGATQGNMVVVTKGIGENDTIIAGNLQKIGPGALVRVAPPAKTGA